MPEGEGNGIEMDETTIHNQGNMPTIIARFGLRRKPFLATVAIPWNWLPLGAVESRSLSRP
jgi:hypothetical protein